MRLVVRDDGRVPAISLEGDPVIGDPEAAFNKTVTRLVEEGKEQILIDCTRLRLVDAVVIAMTERLGAAAIATLDLRHFGAIKIRGSPRLYPRDP